MEFNGQLNKFAPNSMLIVIWDVYRDSAWKLEALQAVFYVTDKVLLYKFFPLVILIIDKVVS